MPRVTHFEIHGEDLKRLQSFYHSLFGWTYERWPGTAEYWSVKTGPDGVPGIDGGMVQRRGGGPGPHTPIASFVCSVEGPERAQSVLDRAVALGGSVAVPVQEVGAAGELCYLKDPEGNVVGYMGPPQLQVPKKTKL
jgi:predicted enzyme related to lactoylglutathione lyase